MKKDIEIPLDIKIKINKGINLVLFFRREKEIDYEIFLILKRWSKDCRVTDFGEFKRVFERYIFLEKRKKKKDLTNREVGLINMELGCIGGRESYDWMEKVMIEKGFDREVSKAWG